MAGTDRVVCFDIGGVLVRIRHSWDQAVIATSLPAQSHHVASLNSFEGILSYQEGTMSEKEYLVGLGEWLGVSEEEAASVHRAVLNGEYPGAANLVKTLQEEGIYTCCFSNTNGLHWKFLTDPDLHPAVANLDQKIPSHELGAAKPDLHAFALVDRLLPPHRQVIFFDDTAENVAAAREFGWTSFRIDPYGDPILQMRETLAKLDVIP